MKDVKILDFRLQIKNTGEYDSWVSYRNAEIQVEIAFFEIVLHCINLNGFYLTFTQPMQAVF